MKMQRIIEMLARMDTNMKTMQERAEADRKTYREEMKQKIWAYKEQMLAKMDAWLADMKACQETTACNEVTEADIEKIEPDSGVIQSVGEH
jgi:cytochrome c556